MKYRLYKAHTGEREVTAMRKERGDGDEDLVALFYDHRLAERCTSFLNGEQEIKGHDDRQG